MTASSLIGLGGYLGSGKDAIADRLVEAHGFVKMGMSDALHEALLAIDPMVESGDEWGTHRYSDEVRTFGYVQAKRNPEVRRLLQALGTEVGRKMFGENFWTSIVERRIHEAVVAGDNVVITGMRFPNEVRMIHQMGGDLVWVNRPGYGAPPGSHASETSVGPDDFDVVVQNDGTLADLSTKSDRLVAVVR